MNLELKHLAPYLPYGLKINLTRSCFERTNIDFMGTTIAYNSATKEHYIIKNAVTYGMEHIKPILRPLSDLVKEIEVNGKRFVPKDYFEDTYYTLDLHEQCNLLIGEDGENWVNQCDYMLVDYLFEWHFDVFGLIEQGLAIDINTLKS